MDISLLPLGSLIRQIHTCVCCSQLHVLSSAFWFVLVFASVNLSMYMYIFNVYYYVQINLHCSFVNIETVLMLRLYVVLVFLVLVKTGVVSKICCFEHSLNEVDVCHDNRVLAAELMS